MELARYAVVVCCCYILKLCPCAFLLQSLFVFDVCWGFFSSRCPSRAQSDWVHWRASQVGFVMPSRTRYTLYCHIVRHVQREIREDNERKIGRGKQKRYIAFAACHVPSSSVCQQAWPYQGGSVCKCSELQEAWQGKFLAEARLCHLCSNNELGTHYCNQRWQ